VLISQFANAVLNERFFVTKLLLVMDKTNQGKTFDLFLEVEILVPDLIN
jgi:hypothetical protein